RQRAGGGLHPIRGTDVVFDQNRNAVQGTARTFASVLTVEFGGDCLGIMIELNYRVQAWSLLVPVQSTDSLQILLGQPARRELSRLHARLQLGESDLVKLGRRKARGHFLLRGGIDRADRRQRSRQSGNHARLQELSSAGYRFRAIVFVFRHWIRLSSF